MPLEDFGVNGVVDLKKDADQELDPIDGEIAWNGAPVVAKNVVLVGAAHRAGTDPASRNNAKGYIRGYDARTGKRLWIFHTIPQPGEFGNDTWLEKSWEYTGNTGVWTQMTVDEQLGIAYLPVEIPTGDYYGGHRPGNNLFGETLVARRSADRQAHLALPVRASPDLGLRHPVRADPGRHHRQRPHDRGGRAADQAGLHLRVRSQDRRAGVADRRAARSSRARCRASGIRRRSPSPPSRRRSSARDSCRSMCIDFTPELKAEALKLIEKYKIGPLYTPPIAQR